ncbi:MAG: hypothetical protein L3J39_03110 [Verrucomicrobiales bacterium]|nr:hypothetical protein [Verrucomicrobiales bacterium]
MYRILIADADPSRACHLEVDLGDLGIKAVSVMSGEMAVAFCREYDLDLVLLDLSMPDAWDAVRLLRQNEATATMPIVGISTSNEEEASDGAVGGSGELCGLLDGKLQRLDLAQALRKCLPGEQSLLVDTGGTGVKQRDESESYLNGASADHTEEDNLKALLALSERILVLAEGLKSSADQFGEDGPEMFDFVEKSSQQMHRRLNEIVDAQESGGVHLADREVRHDFRNILASVRGFTDLILMEEGVPENSIEGLREICSCSSQFVECLDAEKHSLVV